MPLITCKKANQIDFSFFYKIKSNDSLDQVLNTNRLQPDYAQLKNWYNSQITSESKSLLFMNSDGYPCGFCALDIFSEAKTVELNFGLSADFSEKGIETKMIKLAKDFVENNFKEIKVISIWILDANSKQAQFFIDFGFVKNGAEKFEEKEKMHLFSFLI